MAFGNFLFGAGFAAALLLGWQWLQSPGSYEECVLAKSKTWGWEEQQYVNVICTRQFPPIKIKIKAPAEQ